MANQFSYLASDITPFYEDVERNFCTQMGKESFIRTILMLTFFLQIT